MTPPDQGTSAPPNNSLELPDKHTTTLPNRTKKEHELLHIDTTSQGIFERPKRLSPAEDKEGNVHSQPLRPESKKKGAENILAAAALQRPQYAKDKLSGEAKGEGNEKSVGGGLLKENKE
jgi:hypothetical protein